MKNLRVAAFIIVLVAETTRVQAQSLTRTEQLNLQQEVYDAQYKAAVAESEADAARAQAAANKGPSANEIATAIVTKQREDQIAREYANAIAENEASKAYLKQAEQKHREWLEGQEAAEARQRSEYAKAHPSFFFEAQVAAQQAAEEKARSARVSTEISKAPVDRVEAEAKSTAQEARERARRFAPDGTVYNLKTIRVTAGKKKVIVAPETELRLTRKNADGTVHVQTDDFEADVPAESVTNDRDWIQAYRNLHAGEDR